jgi:hypothetical protein
MALLAALLGATPAAALTEAARLTVTQRALIVQCVDGVAVPTARRSWTVTAPVTVTVTMRNQPRSGVATAGDAAPGSATVRFTPEPGHRYELEVRADATRFALRVWPKGTWTPVVRDRTTDTVVTGRPEWTDAACATGGR